MILSQDTKLKISQAGTRYPKIRSAILPALHLAYEEHGFLNDQMYEQIAEVLGVKFIEVAEAASFYTMFPKAPRGRYLIQVCRNISCALMGSHHLTQYLLTKFGVKLGETTKDGLFTVVEVECLGSCCSAPMMQVNEKYFENLTQAKVDQLIAEWKAAK
ncbi:MAG: NAD(P)H-dependent oxidoreductase subunit E [candidate division Zixibacteria bacterium]|nr:NAD(P)H-dependent oxidoreductase subunit E [candidate division Zixibacteria bacterium]